MDRTKWLLLVFGMVLFSVGRASAQLTDQHAIGARFGNIVGVTYRYALPETRSAVEGILSIQSNSVFSRFRLVGLYEFHQPLPIAENFNWFYGFGGSVGSFRGKLSDGTASKSRFLLGVDGIVGVEYNIPTTLLSASLDAKPYFDFLKESTTKALDPFGLSIRYRF